MLNRLSSAGLMAVLLTSSLLPAPGRAFSAQAIAPPLAQTSPATCGTEQTALVETLLFRLGALSNPQPTPAQGGMEVATLSPQLRLIAQLPLAESRINPLSSLVSQVTALAAIPDLAADPRAALQAAIAQTAGLITQIGAEYSATQTELLTHLAGSAHRLDQPDQAQALLRQAHQTVATIQGDDGKAKALMAIADRQGQMGDRAAAIATLGEAFSTAQRIIPSPEYPGQRDDPLSRLVALYSQLDDFPQAIAVANTLADASLQGYAKGSLVQALLASQQVEAALAVANSIRQPELKALALSDLGTYYVAQGQDNQATAMFTTAFTTAQQSTDTNNPYRGLRAAQVVQAYGHWQPDAALPWARALPNPPSQALALMAIAIAYRSNDSIAPAEALLAEVLSLTESFTVDQHRTVTNSMINLALEAQSYDWALTLASLIPLTDEAGNLREAMVGQIIYTALEQGQLDSALQSIAQLPPPARERDTWVQRAIDLALDQGQGARADQIVQAEVAADAVLPWLQAQYAIARYEYQTGQPDAAKARLAGATQRIHSLPNLAQKGMELRVIASNLV